MRGLVVLAAMFLAGDVAAADRHFEIDGWQGRPVKMVRGDTRCLMDIPVSEDVVMIVGLNSDGDVALGASHAGWSMAPGSHHRFVYRVGTEATVQATATATSSDTLLAWLSGPDYARHLSPFARTRNISIEAAGHSIEFQLEGAPRAVESLLACVQIQLESRPTFTQRIIEMFRLP